MDRAGRMASVVGAAMYAVVLTLASCKDSATAPPYQADLDALRAATAAFTDIDAAASAGYTTALTGCMADAQQGGMGYHIGNGARIDGTVELTHPEVVMYEPTAGGGRLLVGLEFLVPFDAWTSPTPPSLMGQSYKRNETFGVWALHVWLYRDNAAGIFADWNAAVSCAHAPTAAVHTH
jgi:hypothetical protein